MVESIFTRDLFVLKRRSPIANRREYNALYTCRGPLVQEVNSISENDSELILNYYSNSRTLLSLDEKEVELACDSMLALVDAVEWCHRCGYVHGDIKPSNVIILPDKRIKLIDFGAALPVGTEYDALEFFEYTPKKFELSIKPLPLLEISLKSAVFDNDWENLIYYAEMINFKNSNFLDNFMVKIAKIIEYEKSVRD